MQIGPGGGYTGGVRKFLRSAALLVLLTGLGVWMVTGCHRGWSRTSSPRWQIDPVTEIRFSIDEKKFVAGVDFLGACLLAAGGLAAVSFFARKK